MQADELKRAIEQGVLSVEGWLPPFSDDPTAGLLVDIDEMFDVSLDAFVARLGDLAHQPMLDAGAQWVAQNWKTAGRPEALESEASWRTSMLVAGDLIMRLPGLDRLPLIDVLDLREDLSDYLPAFRAEMVRLGEEVASADGIKSTDLTAEVERRWHKEIAPVLSEIKQQVAAASYPRRLLNAVTAEKDSLLAVGGAFALSAGSVAAGLSMLIPATAAAAYPFAKALNESKSAMTEARKNRLYFLYELQRGIEQRIA